MRWCLMLAVFDCITYICYGKQCKQMYGLTSSGQPYSVAHNIQHHAWKNSVRPGIRSSGGHGIGEENHNIF
jgi:hypothetical protein